MPWALAGAIAGFVAVALGAFGAHALKAKLSPADLAIFETGVRYQFYHALALFAVEVVAWVSRAQGQAANGYIRAAGWSFCFGIVVFSGSLYLLVGTGVRRWGMVTPLGGLAFLVGWALLARVAAQARQ